MALHRNKFHDYCQCTRRKVSGKYAGHLSKHTQGMEDYKTMPEYWASKVLNNDWKEIFLKNPDFQKRIFEKSCLTGSFS